MQPKLTIGMPHHDDYDGAVFTLQHLALNHALGDGAIEILIINNSPESPAGRALKDFVRSCNHPAIRIVDVPGNIGPSGAKNAVFEHGRGRWRMCIDCHVLFVPGAIEKALEYIDEHPDSLDLFTGPLLHDNRREVSTHFEPVWRGEMHGIWATDERGKDPNGEPFEIWGNGCFLMLCREDAWLGFNPHWTGFGGEEGYIHEKFRKAGRKVICLPFMRAWHRFGRPNGVRYQLSRWTKVRNYVLGHQELGLDLTPVYNHFVNLDCGDVPLAKHLVEEHSFDPKQVNGKSEAELQALHATKKITQADWDYLVADPIKHVAPIPQVVANPNQPPVGASLDAIFEWTNGKPRDLDKHLPKLRELTLNCEHVTEFTERRESTVALVAGRAKTVVSYQKERDDLITRLHEAVAGDAQVSQAIVAAGGKRNRYTEIFTVHQGADSLQVEPIADTDLLFIDTSPHNAERLWEELAKHAPKVRRYIVLHDTALFGYRGEGDKGGLLAAMARWMNEHPEWSVVYHTQEQHGLSVMSRDQRDKPKLPSVITMAANFSKAMAEHVADGLTKTPKEQYQARLERCTICEHRNDNRCSVCGCGLSAKAALRSSQCPLGYWPQIVELKVEENKDAAA